MEKNQKQKETELETQTEAEKSKDKEEQESLEELREVMKKLEEMSKNKSQQKPHRNIIALEFGGVFHHNRIINFIFTYILTFTIAFFITELFNFVVYHDIIYFAGLILAFNVIEEEVKHFVMIKYFRIVLRTFGTVFYFIYLLIFFILDQYVFISVFNFHNGVVLPFFVFFLAVIRYVFAHLIRNFLRYRSMR